MTIHNPRAAFEAIDTDGLPPAIAAALKDLCKGVGSFQDRLDALEAKLGAPRLGGVSVTDKDALHGAINKYLRQGRQALDARDVQVLDIRNDLTGAGDGAGLESATYFTELVDLITQYSPMRDVARVMQIGTSSVYIPRLTAQLAGTWVTETGARQSSNPVYDQIQITPYEHAVIVPVSRQLLDDSVIDLAADINEDVGTQFGKAEATAFVTGDGNGKPTGFLHSPSDFTLINVAQSAADSDVIGAVIDLFYSLPTAYSSRGSWLMNRSTIAKLRKALDANPGARALWSDGVASLAGPTPPRLLGAPVLEAVDMPDWIDTSGSPTVVKYPVAFGDWMTGYRIVDRIGVAIINDPFTGADTGIVKVRARRRVGGKVVRPEAIALIKAQ